MAILKKFYVPVVRLSSAVACVNVVFVNLSNCSTTLAHVDSCLSELFLI